MYKQLCPCKKLMVEFPMASELIGLGPLSTTIGDVGDVRLHLSKYCAIMWSTISQGGLTSAPSLYLITIVPK
jgi:hypothetical protein